MWYSLILDLLCVETVYRLLPFCGEFGTVVRTKKPRYRLANLCSIAAHSARVAVALGASVEDVLPVRIPFLTHHCTAFSAYAETEPVVWYKKS